MNLHRLSNCLESNVLFLIQHDKFDRLLLDNGFFKFNCFEKKFSNFMIGTASRYQTLIDAIKNISKILTKCMNVIIETQKHSQTARLNGEKIVTENHLNETMKQMRFPIVGFIRAIRITWNE